MSCWGFLLALERSALGRSSASSAVVSLFFFFCNTTARVLGYKELKMEARG